MTSKRKAVGTWPRLAARRAIMRTREMECKAAPSAKLADGRRLFLQSDPTAKSVDFTAIAFGWSALSRPSKVDCLSCALPRVRRKQSKPEAPISLVCYPKGLLLISVVLVNICKFEWGTVDL
jgi:hypothetical protein